MRSAGHIRRCDEERCRRGQTVYPWSRERCDGALDRGCGGRASAYGYGGVFSGGGFEYECCGYGRGVIASGLGREGGRGVIGVCTESLVTAVMSVVAGTENFGRRDRSYVRI